MPKYRKIYEDAFGIEIPYGFVVHHIDEDRSNNNISNLLMIPEELHRRWHSIKQRCSGTQMMESLDYMFGIDNNGFPVAASMIEEYLKTRWDVQDWINEKQKMAYRTYLKGVGL